MLIRRSSRADISGSTCAVSRSLAPLDVRPKMFHVIVSYYVHDVHMHIACHMLVVVVVVCMQTFDSRMSPGASRQRKSG